MAQSNEGLPTSVLKQPADLLRQTAVLRAFGESIWSTEVAAGQYFCLHACELHSSSSLLVTFN